MKAILSNPAMPEAELTLSDNGFNDPRLIGMAIGESYIEVDVIELYRSLMPFMGKLTPEQTGTKQL